MVTNMTSENVFQFTGLSSDKKPIGKNCKPNDQYEQYDYNIGNGSIFFEMDTVKAYILKLEEDTEGKFTATWLAL